MTPGAQTIGNIAVYGSTKQLLILFMDWTANPTQSWSFAVADDFFLVYLPKLREISLSQRSCYHIPMK